MRSTILTMAGLLVAALLLPTSAAWAGDEGDPPDLMDVDDTFYDNNVGDSSSNWMWMTADDQTASASGSITASNHEDGSDWEAAGIYWQLYEPDRVRRIPRKARIRQKDYLFVQAWAGWHVGEGEGETSSYAYETTSADVEGCRALVIARDTTPYPDIQEADCENCPDFGRWVVRCRNTLSQILGDEDGMNLDADDIEDFLEVMGATGNEHEFRGRATNREECDEEPN